jgi:hypothetical protein
VTDVDQALSLGVAFPVEVLVPRFQLGEEASEELFRRCFVLGVPVDVQRRRRVDRRLDNARGLAIARDVGVVLSVPEVYAGKVLAEAGVEDYLGQHPVPPLTLEEVREFAGGALLVVARVANGDERRVPRPLVGVKMESRASVLPVPVKVQHHLGLLHELLIWLRHGLRLPLSRFRRPSAAPNSSRHAPMIPPTGHSKQGSKLKSLRSREVVELFPEVRRKELW